MKTLLTQNKTQSLIVFDLGSKNPTSVIVKVFNRNILLVLKHKTWRIPMSGNKI